MLDHGRIGPCARYSASATPRASASPSGYADHRRGLALGPRGAHRGPFVLRQHGPRGLDDLRRRSVVRAEPDDRRARELVGESRQEPGVGARERIDRLVGVADDAEVRAVTEPGAQQVELRAGHVLELVDEEVPEPPPLRGRELGVRLERFRARADEIVEVEETALALLALVARVDARDLIEGDGASRAGWPAPASRTRSAVRGAPSPTRPRTRSR